MTNEERFKQNLEKWAPLNFEAAQKLKFLECKEVFICQNEDGRFNLKKTSGELTQYYHSTLSPEREAQQWFLSLDLKNILVLYVYGIGLGYYYDIIKTWLKEDVKRYVIFLEDNLEVIKCFLETERATEFLNDYQVKLIHFDWESSYFSFGFITSLFLWLPLKHQLSSFMRKPKRFISRNFTRVSLTFMICASEQVLNFYF